MPALVKYERKPLSMGQICAVRDYIESKRLRREVPGNGRNGPSESNDYQLNNHLQIECCGPMTPPPPSAKQIREEKEHCLEDISDELSELENTLEQLKQKKHGLFEELKSLLSKEKERKKAEEEERHLHGFPFLAQLTGASSLLTVSPPYKHSLVGMKRSKSPSPPLVQIYSTNPHPLMTSSHHPSTHNTFGEVQKSMSSKMPDNMVSSFQCQQLTGEQSQTNISDSLSGFINQFNKERPGFTHRPQGQTKRGSHIPNRSSRHY